MRRIVLALALLAMVANPALADIPVTDDFRTSRGLSLNITNDFFNKLESDLAPFISSIDPNDFLGGNDSFSFSEAGFDVEVQIQGIELEFGGPVSVDVFPQAPSNLNIAVNVPRVKVNIRVVVDTPVPFVPDITSTGDIQAGINITGSLVPTMDDLGLGLQAQNLQVSLVNPEPNIGGILEFLVDLIFDLFLQDTIDDLITDPLIDVINDLFNGDPLVELAPILLDLLGGYPVGLVGAIDDRYATSNQYALGVESGFFPLGTLRGETFFSPDPSNPRVPYSNRTPNANVPYHLALTVSDDLLNNIFMVVTKSGLVELQVDNCLLSGITLPLPGLSLTSDLLRLMAPQDAAVIPSGAPLIMDISLAGGIYAKTDQRQIHVEDLEADISFVEDAEQVHAFTLALDMNVGIDFDLNATTGQPEVDIDIPIDSFGLAQINTTITERGVIQNTPEAQVSGFLAQIVGLILSTGSIDINGLVNPLLNDLVNIDLLGLTPIFNEITYDGPNGDNLSLYLTLDGSLDLGSLLASDEPTLRQGPGPSNSPVNFLAVAKRGTLRVYNEADLTVRGDYTLANGSNNDEPIAMEYTERTGALYVVSNNGNSHAIDVYSASDGSFSRTVNATNLGGEAGAAIVNRKRRELVVLNLSNESADMYDISQAGVINLKAGRRGGVGPMRDIALNEEDDILFTIYRDNIIAAHDLTGSGDSSTVRYDFPDLELFNHGVFHPRSKRLFVYSDVAESIYVFNAADDIDGLELLRTIPSTNFPRDLYLDKTGEFLILETFQPNQVIFYDANTLEQVDQLAGIVNDISPLSESNFGFAYAADALGGSILMYSFPGLMPLELSPINESSGTTLVEYFNTGRTETVLPTFGSLSSLSDTTDTAGPYYVTLSGAADDVALGEAYLEYRYDANPWKRVKMAMADCETYVGKITAEGTGTVTYRAIVYDQAGNFRQTTDNDFVIFIPTATPTFTPTSTPTATATFTPTSTPTTTPTPTATPTSTPTPLPTSTPQPASVTYDFTAGWNSFALGNDMGQGFDTANLAGMLFDPVLRESLLQVGAGWVQGGWEVYMPFTSSMGFPIVPGEGYLLYLKDDSSITMDGSAINASVPLSLTPGWNFVSVPFSATPHTASTLLEAINSGQGGTVAPYVVAFADGIWVVHAHGMPFNNFAIEPTRGYFVYSMAPATVTP